jgi:hypothetical protein
MTSEIIKEHCDLKTTLKFVNVAVQRHNLHFNLAVV